MCYLFMSLLVPLQYTALRGKMAPPWPSGSLQPPRGRELRCEVSIGVCTSKREPRSSWRDLAEPHAVEGNLEEANRQAGVSGPETLVRRSTRA